MRSPKAAVATAALLSAACSDSGYRAPQGHFGETGQGVHGPIPNVLVRLLNAPSGDSVVCNPHVKGLAPSLGSTYRTTLTLTYPSAAIAQQVGTVTLASPSYVDNTNGKFAVALEESPASSGEYVVKASFKRATTERTAGIHRCDVHIEEDGDGDTVFEKEWLNALGEARHQVTQSGSWRQSTSHRLSNGHVICRSRLNFPDPLATYYVDVGASTSGGSGSLFDLALSLGSPAIGPLPLAGGTVVVEWGVPPEPFPQPSVDVRFDYSGQELGSSSICSALITQNAPGGAPVLDGDTRMLEAAPACGLAAPCAFGCCSAVSGGTCLAGTSNTACGSGGVCTDCTASGLHCHSGTRMCVPNTGCVTLSSPADIPSPTTIDFDDLGNSVVVGTQYQSQWNVVFGDGMTTVVTYGGEPAEAASAPNVAFNVPVFGTNANVPLTISFGEPQSFVGMMIGNGEMVNPLARLTAYDASGFLLCTASVTAPEPHTTFLGVRAYAGTVRRIQLDYGSSTLAESIDDLSFAP